MQLPNLIGLLVYAQPTDRSQPLDLFAVLSQTVENDTQFLELVPAYGGLLSSQVQLVPIKQSAGGWSVAAYVENSELVRQIVDSLTTALTSSELTLSDETQIEATNVRAALVDALAARARIVLNEEREAEDARIAAERAAEDREFDAHHELLAADPTAQQPEQEATLIIVSGSPEVIQEVQSRLRDEMSS